MRQKTYLFPEYQWYMTAELVMNHPAFNGLKLRNGYDDRPGPKWDVSLRADGGLRSLSLGYIAHTHRLFVPGDVVLVQNTNGAGARQPVWAVSSKGHRVEGCYLRYARYWNGYKVLAGFRLELANRPPGGRMSGPLRLVELPDDLDGSRPDDPAVWRFVAALHAGSAAAG